MIRAIWEELLPPVPTIEPAELFEDRLGLAFGAVRSALPENTRAWPSGRSLKAPQLLRFCHEEMWRCSNPWCAAPNAWWAELELHHIIGGRGGRSDERTNLLPLCRWCHQGPKKIEDNLGFVLFLKWLQAAEELDWLRLAALHGRFLPELWLPEGLQCQS